MFRNERRRGEEGIQGRASVGEGGRGVRDPGAKGTLGRVCFGDASQGT